MSYCPPNSSYAALALLQQYSLYAVLAGVFICYTFSEFSIIASISLFSSPFIAQSRGTMISVFVGSFSAGRMIGALSLERVYTEFGYSGCVLGAASTMAFAIVVFVIMTSCCCCCASADASEAEETRLLPRQSE
jgi:predicted MFS family arabinose efflux permease